jgi:DNA-binding IclR family transcriptional regulator
VLHSNDIVYIDRARSSWQGHSEVSVRLGRGSRLPASVTAMGRVLLSHRSREEQDAAIEASMKISGQRPTPKARDKLRQELEVIHDRGFAIAGQVHVEGQRCVAAPVRSQSAEVIAAVDVAAPTAGFSEGAILEQLTPLVIGCAQEMSAHLGYSAPV